MHGETLKQLIFI